jgi:hypothetical protein
VPLRIAAGKLEIGEHAICFRCMADAAPIECSISRQALQDLAGAYALPLETSDLAAFSQLLSQIEKIADRKYPRARFEKNGELKIGTADLLRYGFKRPRRSRGYLAALVRTVSSSTQI